MSRSRSVIACKAISLAYLLFFYLQVQAAEPERRFLGRYCADCHSAGSAEGGFTFDDNLAVATEIEGFETWSKVYDRVRTGEMPPADAEQPTADHRSAVLGSLKNTLTRVDKRRQSEFGRAELRRLSRIEYANALKDILALPHLEIVEKLPPDGLAHGFQKSAAALDFSHVMVARYLEEADRALWQAVAPRAKPHPRETIRAEFAGLKGVRDSLQTLYVQLKQTTAMPLVGLERDPTLNVTKGNFAKRDPGTIKDPLPHFDGVATFMHSRSNHNIVVKPFKVKQSGYYTLRVHGWGLLNDHGKIVPSDRSETVAFYSPTGRLLGRCDVPPNVPTTSETTVWLNEGEPVEYLAVSAPNEKFQIQRQGDAPRYEFFKAYGIGLRWLEMEGPLDASWPPESHRRLFGDLPLVQTETNPNGLDYRVDTEQPLEDAQRLLSSFAQRALRRPANDNDICVALKLVRGKLDRSEPFLDAMVAGYRALLASPAFLLVDEQPGPLDAWALATRLSLFLTNGPPDEALRKLAASGALLEPTTLREQTNRLIDADHAERFVEHFLDDWLDLRNIRLTEPDENLYPGFNALLGESMVAETRAYFLAMLREDLPAWHVIDSDFAMVNQRLAEVYELDGVRGSAIRRVPLPRESVRGGLLTQASLLKITANGTTTSPVVRGAFTLTKLLGDPPPPPPAAVSAIEPDISGATTVRDQLARHREDAACAVCHQKIDPPGFALESFDVTGQYRERYRSTDSGNRVDAMFNGKRVTYRVGLPVDPSGQFEDGTPFQDIHEFRKILLQREREVARNLLHQLITYATGAAVSIGDEEIVAQMLGRLQKSDFCVRAMIHEVVQSQLFVRK